jgi:hypothetical protein
MMLRALALAAAATAVSPVQGSVFGPIVSVSGTTFTITTPLSPNGKSIVSAAGARITEPVAAPRSSLKVGACVAVFGSRNAKGVVAATRITISEAVEGKCTPAGGFRVGPTGAPPPEGAPKPGGGFQPRIGPGGFAVGTVTKVAGSTVTVKGVREATTVTVSSKTALERIATVQATELRTKTCAFVRGTSSDKGKTVRATDIAISPELNGTCSNGFRVAGR